MKKTKKNFYLQLPCGHISTKAKDEGENCPKCLSSTEEIFVITKKMKETLNQKCREGCGHMRRACFWPCHCNPFCQMCAESYFSTQPTGREKCCDCGEEIENIYTVMYSSKDKFWQTKTSGGPLSLPWYRALHDLYVCGVYANTVEWSRTR